MEHKQLISVILPSRGRPEQLYRCIASALSLSARPTLIEFIVYIDDDDSSYDEMLHKPVLFQVIRGPRNGIGQANQDCANLARGEILLFINDDIIVETPNWDEGFRAIDTSIKDGVYLAYPNDGFKGRKLCPFHAIRRSTFKLMGKPFRYIEDHLLTLT